MKKAYFTILILVFLGYTQSLRAQCFPALPLHAQTIPFGSNDSSMSFPGSVHHICNNSFYYYYNNNPDTIYLEGSSVLRIGFCTNLTIYVQNNCQVIIDTTTFGMYDIKKIVSDTSYVWFIDTSYATIDSFITCPGMTYNYINFPGAASPCYTLGLEEDQKQTVKVFPTVTNGDLNIETNMDDYSVEIYDLLGNSVLRFTNLGKCSLADRSPGMYLVKVFSGGKPILTQRIFLHK